MRKRALEQSSLVKQQFCENHFTIEDPRQMISNNDDFVAKKIIFFNGQLRGTSPFWARRSVELRSLINWQVNKEKGLPSIFATGSCAEYYCKPLRRLISLYFQHTT